MDPKRAKNWQKKPQSCSSSPRDACNGMQRSSVYLYKGQFFDDLTFTAVITAIKAISAKAAETAIHYESFYVFLWL